MRRPTSPPEMAFFAESRPPAGELALGIDLGGLRWNLFGLDEALCSSLKERYGPYVIDPVPSDASLDVRLGIEPIDYFIDPPAEPELNPVLLALDGDRVRFLGYRIAGWFDACGGEGQILLARGDYEPPERAIENYVRASVAWQAASRGGALVHAASAVLDGRGYLFYGESGAGKSTLSACNRRASVVRDDLSLILADEAGRPQLVGSPFRGTYEGGDPVLGHFPLAAGFRIVQAPEARVVNVSRAIAWSGLVANLPFISDAFPDHPEILERIRGSFASVPLAHLRFCKDDTYWDAVKAAGL